MSCYYPVRRPVWSAAMPPLRLQEVQLSSTLYRGENMDDQARYSRYLLLCQRL